jgi:hypothetical protein
MVGGNRLGVNSRQLSPHESVGEVSEDEEGHDDLYQDREEQPARAWFAVGDRTGVPVAGSASGARTARGGPDRPSTRLSSPAFGRLHPVVPCL